MKAGTYYIGDLCYVLSDSDCDEALTYFLAGRSDHGCNEGQFKFNDGREFVNFNTAYGDGYYPVNNGANVSVDSGSVGCILLDDISNPEGVRLGTVVEFDEDFEVDNQGGRMTFGPIEVDTVSFWDFLEDDEYDEEEEDDSESPK